MKSIEFYDLPRPIQERFVAASQASLAPAPLAVKRGSRFVGARWFIGSVAVLLATLGFALQGFGNLDHPEALASAGRAVLYALGFTLSFACLTRGLTLRDRALSLPFARATYLFPAGVVDAMSSRLSVHSLSELRDVQASAHALSVTFIDGTTFQFPAQSQEQAEAAKRAVSESRQRLDDATRADSVRSLAALDPLCQTNFPSPFSQDIPFKRPTPLWGVALTAMAVLSGAALGVGVWEVRNKLSARRIAEVARAQDTTQAYRLYLERGGQHPDIVDVLLPRAELAEAKAAGSVAAIERYIEAHPDSKIQAEVDAALEDALLASLAKAKSVGTLAALERFASEYPRHTPVAEELAAARHAVYVGAAARAKAMLVAGEVRSQSPAAFIDRLVAYAEQHGPKVLIRFRSYLGSSYDTADNFVRASAFFGGNGTLPSRFFGRESMRKREALIAPILLGGLQPLFAPEIIHFELGEPLASPEPGERPEPLPAPELPTLFIDHRTELSGAHLNLRPRGIFFGAGIFFETSFVIPGQKDALQIVVPTWRAPSRNVMQHKTRTMADVYEDLARRSFGMFLRRYFERLMRSPPEISVPDIELPAEDSASG
jgi:hypothetical protein